MLELLRDHDGLSAEHMMIEIQRLHRDTISILAKKNIAYAELRAGLVPQLDREEALFLFDSEETGSGLYGRDVFAKVIPLLDPRSTQSLLIGDLLGEDQQLILDILREEMVLARSFSFKHATLIFGIYINNLTTTMRGKLHEGLRSFPAYLGYIPTTFFSRGKIYASITLSGFALKVGKTFIIAHEEDRPNSENIDITIFNLEQHGYRVASLQGIYHSNFLTFKIERPVASPDVTDQELSLNAVSAQVLPLARFQVGLEEAKYGYLLREKLGKLNQAGIGALDRVQIEQLIQSRVASNYIYNLEYLDAHDVIKFNIMLEVERAQGYPARLVAALEYIPTSEMLRVITLY